MWLQILIAFRRSNTSPFVKKSLCHFPCQQTTICVKILIYCTIIKFMRTPELTVSLISFLVPDCGGIEEVCSSPSCLCCFTLVLQFLMAKKYHYLQMYKNGNTKYLHLKIRQDHKICLKDHSVYTITSMIYVFSLYMINRVLNLDHNGYSPSKCTEKNTFELRILWFDAFGIGSMHASVNVYHL